MNIKLLSLVVLLSGVAYADGGEALATGFVQSLNRRLGGSDYTPPPEVQQYQPQIQTIVINNPHYDAITAGGFQAGFVFPNYHACHQFITNSPEWYGSCEFFNQ